MIDKINSYDIDLFIKVVDYANYTYEVSPFKYHADYDTYKLIFSFEKCCGGVMTIVGEYVNAEHKVLIKYQYETFEELLQRLKEWCNNHRIN